VRDAQAVYTDAGVYTVTLTVRDGSNISTVSHTITVSAHTVPSFTYSPNTVCGPQPVTFSATAQSAPGGGGSGGGAIVSWVWDFGDGSTAQAGSAAVQHVYQSSVSVPVSLTVINSYGCADTVSQPVKVTVFTPATSSFNSDKRVLCLATDAVRFTNSSTGPGPLTYSWDFGDGASSALPNPGHSYAQKGIYTVKLTTTTADGCSATSSQPNYLNVASYSTDFDVPSAAVCQNTSVLFTDRSSPTADSRVWTIDGAPVYYYTPLQTTLYTPGTHTVQLSNLFGACPQSASKTVTVNPVPVIAPFDQQVTRACDQYSVQFTDHTTDAVSWNWNFNYYYNGPNQPSTTASASASFSYNQTYGVQLTVTGANGCVNSLVQQVYVAKPPVTVLDQSAGPNASCQTPITKSYAIQNKALLQTWHWEFGDGATSADGNPTHVYSGVGSYSPVLYYTDINGCSSTASAPTVIISGPVTLDFSATPTTVCAGTNVSFTPTSTGGPYYYWDFGDGNGSGSPAYVYQRPGAYSVTLRGTNTGGCQATLTKQNLITVLEPPGSFGGHTNTCDGDRTLVTFTYTPGPAASVLWKFGDGGTLMTDANTTQVQHTYAGTGTYYPEITASNNQCNATNSDRVMVLKKQQPKLTADNTVACLNGTLNVHLAIERNPAEVNVGYYYDYTPAFQYSDGTPFTGNVVFTTPFDPYSNGAFHWTLSGLTAGKSGLQVVTTSFGFGCTDVSNAIPLTIRGSATAAFTVVSDNHCYQSPVVLKDVSTPGANNSIVSETWDFGDGQTTNWSASQAGGTISHIYTNPGQYAVRLSVADAAGCTASSGANQSYVSANGPKASFAPSGTDVNLNSTVYFYNNSNYYGANNTVWSWDFGDGSVSSGYYPSHTYTVPGKYTVTLMAKDPANINTCVTTATAVINVRNFNSHFSTSASYVGASSCPPMLARFVNTSSNYMSVSWDFGDGWTAGNVNTPSHVYQQPGRYIVTLFVQGYNGLSASYIDSVFVRQPAADMSALTPIVCLGQAAAYQAKAVGAKSYTWDFGDGSVASASYPDSVISHNYASAGGYLARLVVTDTFGCSMAAGLPVSLLVHALPKLVISPADPFLCKDASVTLTASGASTYVWSPATGLNRTDIASPVAAPKVNTIYQVLATDDAGCQSTGSVNVQVVFPQPVTVTPDSTSVCAGGTVTLKASGADVYSWIGDLKGSDINAPGEVTARPSASSIFTVIGRDIHACFADTANVIVTVLPVPTVNGGPDVEVIAANPVVLQAIGSADVTEWKWTPADYLSCTDCGQPVASPKRPETYIVKVTNDLGCTASDTVQAKILCEESLVRIPDAFSPNGDGKNDRFVILGIGEVKHLVIYSRWGVKVWEKNNFYPADAGSCWDGTMGGHPAPVGAYAYYVEMICPAGGVFGRRGTVVLVR
jgi:gliding motility-associated-like protein